MGESYSQGYLKIGSEADRVTVASILYRNGYGVTPVRKKKNGKTYEYFVKYEFVGTATQEDGMNES
jgi:hypothetical protein